MAVDAAAMGQAGGTLLGAAVGMSSSKRASRDAEKAQEMQKRMFDQDLAFRQKMYEEAQAKYGPLEQQLLGQSMSSRPLGYEMLSGQIQQQYADALRNMMSMGYQGGGLQGGAARQAQFGLATALPQAYGQGQMNRLNLATSMLGRSPVYGLGQNVSGAFGNQAGFYGQQAGMYGQLAGLGSQAAARALQQFGYQLGQNYQNSQGQQPDSLSMPQFDTLPTPNPNLYDDIDLTPGTIG